MHITTMIMMMMVLAGVFECCQRIHISRVGVYSGLRVHEPVKTRAHTITRSTHAMCAHIKYVHGMVEC